MNADGGNIIGNYLRYRDSNQLGTFREPIKDTYLRLSVDALQ